MTLASTPSGSWRAVIASGLCVGEPTEWWQSHPNSQRAREAVAICRKCPVIDECRTWIMSVEDPARPYGIAGGLNAAERRRLHTEASAGESQ